MIFSHLGQVKGKLLHCNLISIIIFPQININWIKWESVTCTVYKLQADGGNTSFQVCIKCGGGFREV